MANIGVEPSEIMGAVAMCMTPTQIKKYSEKGHSKSLNMIPKYVKTKYFLNWEDDTEFKYPKNYITDAIDILESSNGKLLVIGV